MCVDSVVVTELGLPAAVGDAKVVLRVAVTTGDVTLVTALALGGVLLLGVSLIGEELPLVGGLPAGAAAAVVGALALALAGSSPSLYPSRRLEMGPALSVARGAGVPLGSGLRPPSETLLEAFPSSGTPPRDTRITLRTPADFSAAGGSLIPRSKSFLVEENFCARATLSISTSSPLGALSGACDGSGLDAALLKFVFGALAGNCALVGDMGDSGISVFSVLFTTS